MLGAGIDPERGSGAELQRANHEILDAIPAEAGPRITTGRGAAFYAVRPPGREVFRPKHHFAGVMLAPTPRVRARLGRDGPCEFDAPIGQIFVNPANVESSWEWPAVMEIAVIALTEASLRELAEREFGSGDARLVPPPLGARDTTALTIGQLLKADLTRGEGSSELYADTLITLFGIHLLRNYTLQKQAASKGKRRTGP